MPRRRGLSGGDADIDIQLAAPSGSGGFASTVDDTVTHAVLIESFRRPGVTMMFGGFLVAVAACLVIGVAGPEVIVSRSDNNALTCGSDHCSTIWNGTLVQMTELHQVLYLEAVIERELSVASAAVHLEYQQEVVVTAYGISSDGMRNVIVNHRKHVRNVVCPAHQAACDPFVVFAQNFIRYHTYEIQVQFIHPAQAFLSQSDVGTLFIDLTLHRVNSNFTLFEMCIRYAFLAVTLVLSLLFWFKLTRMPPRVWSYEQKWIGAVLVGLVFFNNPLVGVEVFFPSLVWTGLSVIGMVTFLALLLLFWLCIIDVVRTSASDEQERPRGLGFYLPKVALLTAFWMVVMILYMFSRLQQEEDPSFNAPDDFHTYVFVKVLAYCIMAVYTVWLLVLITLGAKQLSELSLPFKVVFVLSAVSIIALLVCLFLGAYAPFAITSAMFMALYGITNVYVFTLSLAYLPWVSEYASNIRGGELELGGFGSDDEEAGLVSAAPTSDADILDSDDGRGDGGAATLAATRPHRHRA